MNDTDSSLASNDTAPSTATEEIITTVASNGDIITSPVARPPAPYEPPAPTQTPEAPAPHKFTFRPLAPGEAEDFIGHHASLDRIANDVVNEADRAAMEAHDPGRYDALVERRRNDVDIYRYRNKANWARYDAIYGAGD